MELNAVVLARYSNPYRQQKQMERTVARKGKSRWTSTCEKNSE